MMIVGFHKGQVDERGDTPCAGCYLIVPIANSHCYLHFIAHVLLFCCYSMGCRQIH